MPKDPLKTRLEIAKNKVSKKNLFDKKNNPSPIGTAFKLSTELVAADAGRLRSRLNSKALF